MMDYELRREKFSEALKDYTLALVAAGNAPYSVADELYPFEVNRDFYYLTGIDRPKMVYMLWKEPQGYAEYLFIERFDPAEARWIGGRMTPEEACKASGLDADSIMYLDELDDQISYYLSRYGCGKTILAAPLRREEVGSTDDWIVRYVNRLKRHYPSLTVKDCSDALTDLRLIKDAKEIKELKKGIVVTDEALRLMWTALKSGINESEAEAWFDFVLKKERMAHSFTSIFASGANATTLHYAENNSMIKPGTLLLTDLGAASNHYCADISRTVPVDGKFSPRQREIYDIVLAANKHIIEYARTGMTIRTLQNETVRFYMKELPKHGLLKNGHTLNEYYFHSVSHMLGLQTHDVSYPDYKIRNGNVFTVEPGLYIEEEGIGIRIEDNIVMKDGRAEVLSSSIIKDPEEIEAFFAAR